MIAFTKSVRRNQSSPAWHSRFLAMLPQIRRQAQIAFHGARAELQEELTAEVFANACSAYARLIELGKEELAYPSTLAHYAIRQVRSGRRVGTKFNGRDVMSPHVRRMNGIALERLDQFDEEQSQWRELLIEDRKAGPAATAIARIDMAAWLKSLPRRKRAIANALARGEATSTVARMFALSAGRISQIREEFRQSWQAFQGELVVE